MELMILLLENVTAKISAYNYLDLATWSSY